MAANEKYTHGEEFADSSVNASDDQEFQIDLVELVLRLLEKAWLIALVGIVFAVGSGVFTRYFMDKTYTSMTKLYVINSGDAAIDLSALNIGEKLADDYVQVFKNRDVYDKVKSGLAVNGFAMPYTYEQVTKMMSVSVINNTRIIQLTFTCNDAAEAERIVTAYANAASSFIANTMKTDEPTIFERARVPEKPSGPSMLRNVVLAFLLGAMATAAVLVIQFVLDDRIRTAEQLEKRLGLSTFGMMPIQDSDKKSHRRVKEGK